MKGKKRVFIVHGWDYNPSMNWYPWLKKELIDHGFEVFVPEMPNTSEPEISSWVEKLKKEVGKVDENTYFVGHSIGCQTIMRYLETLDSDIQIRGCVFVAGWFNLDNLEGEEVEAIAKPWIKTNINLDKVRAIVKKVAVFLSDNDPYNKYE